MQRYPKFSKQRVDALLRREIQDGFDWSLRYSYAPTENVRTKDVFVENVDLWLWSTACKRESRGNRLAEMMTDQLKGTFTCDSREDSWVVLSVHIREASIGDKEGRFLASELKSGLVRLCVAWTLSLPSGNVVLNAGVLDVVDSHNCGLRDLNPFSDAEATLEDYLVPTICKELVARIDIPDEASRFALEPILNCVSPYPCDPLMLKPILNHVTPYPCDMSLPLLCQDTPPGELTVFVDENGQECFEV